MDTDYPARKAEADAREARWAKRLAALTLTPGQADGWDCIGCGEHIISGCPAGYTPGGAQVFVCVECDERFVRELAAEETVTDRLHARADRLAAIGEPAAAAAVRLVTERHPEPTAPVTRLDETVAAVTALDPQTVAIDALHALARDMRWHRMDTHAARVDGIIRVLKMSPTDLEGLAADALMMTGYAPGVDDAAVAAGETLLRALGGEQR